MPQTSTVSLGVVCAATAVATSVVRLSRSPGQASARPQNTVAATVVYTRTGFQRIAEVATAPVPSSTSGGISCR